MTSPLACLKLESFCELTSYSVVYVWDAWEVRVGVGAVGVLDGPSDQLGEREKE